MVKEKLVICVDFDGTCVTHDFPRIGHDIGAVEILTKLVAEGHKLVLFTMRSGDTLEEAVQWFMQNCIPLYGIQKNPTQGRWTSSPKAYGQLYIDDAALGCPLKEDKSLSDRPFVDWNEVRTMLIYKGLIPWKEVEAKDADLSKVIVTEYKPKTDENV